LSEQTCREAQSHDNIVSHLQMDIRPPPKYAIFGGFSFRFARKEVLPKKSFTSVRCL
jgi:hypothetical protein